MSIARQLEEALVGEWNDNDAQIPSLSIGEAGFIVKLKRLRHDAYPGQAAHGVLPIVVVGHESMNMGEWNDWVRVNGVANFGPAYTEKLIENGVELKEMLPTAGFGRTMRRGGLRSLDDNYKYLDRAGDILTAVEKWPSLYNAVVDEMSEEEMTLRDFVDRVRNLPSPLELGRGADTTLGDLLPPLDGMILPGEM